MNKEELKKLFELGVKLGHAHETESMPTWESIEKEAEILITKILSE